MRTQKYNLLTVMLLLCCTAGWAQRKALTDQEGVALKAKVTAQTQHLQSLQSDFTQTKQLSYLENAIRATGKLTFKAPGKIRWEYVSPTPYVVIFNGATMHTVAEGRTTKTDLTANRRMKGLSDLLIGSAQESELLDESRFDIAYYRDGADYIAVLVPKDKGLNRYIRQVELVFDGTRLLLTRVTLTDAGGDSTELAFANQRKNASIPDTVFQP